MRLVHDLLVSALSFFFRTFRIFRIFFPSPFWFSSGCA